MSRPTAEEMAIDRANELNGQIERIADGVERIVDLLEDPRPRAMQPWVRKRLESILGYTAPEALAGKIQMLLDDTKRDEDE